MIVPRDYQEEAVNSIIRYISAGHKRVLFQLATGGGKTVCMSYLLQRYLKRYPMNRCCVLVHREELKQQTLKTLSGFGINNVLVEMVETFNNRMKRSQGYFDLIIIDECHIGNFKKIFQHFEDTLFIGFSATPISATKKHPLKADYEVITCGIDTYELIMSGHLVKAKHYSPKTGLDKKSLKITKGDYNLGQMGMEFSKPKLINAVRDSYIAKAAGTKAIIYNTTIAHSELVNQCFQEYGLPSKHLDSNASPEERKEVLLWLKETPGAILNNVGILTTGFDEPSVETIILNRCTKSLPLYLQMCGRGARPYPEKDHFTIIDLGENAEQHGAWSYKRDWEELFYYPDKPGSGVAPQKECPNCEALIHASATQCEYCGHLMPRKIEYSTDPIELRLIEDIRVNEMLGKAKENNYKESWVVFKMIEKIKKSRMQEDRKLPVFEIKLKEYYKEQGKKIYPPAINFWKEQFNQTAI